ncbi:hypothetical protein [Photobacterium sp. GSS17]|uniref:hypothetical protein n=1 Tax=Photobacterium sp. GSS17 TaxID=3020715 RepID=UPI002361C2D2|nr:hypothetical protein [Photobacterium sp. GSS17]
MRCEDRKDHEIINLIEQFYVYQAVLIRTPLGGTVASVPKYPVYYKKHCDLLEKIMDELNKFGVSVKEAQLPEESRSNSPTSFLDDFMRQDALKLLLVSSEGKVIHPPSNLDGMVQLYNAKLSTPWH